MDKYNNIKLLILSIFIPVFSLFQFCHIKKLEPTESAPDGGAPTYSNYTLTITENTTGVVVTDLFFDVDGIDSVNFDNVLVEIFEADPETGALYVINNSRLDFEVNKQIRGVIDITDKKGYDYALNLVVNISNKGPDGELLSPYYSPLDTRIGTITTLYDDGVALQSSTVQHDIYIEGISVAHNKYLQNSFVQSVTGIIGSDYIHVIRALSFHDAFNRFTSELVTQTGDSRILYLDGIDITYYADAIWAGVLAVLIDATVGGSLSQNPFLIADGPDILPWSDIDYSSPSFLNRQRNIFLSNGKIIFWPDKNYIGQLIGQEILRRYPLGTIGGIEELQDFSIAPDVAFAVIKRLIKDYPTLNNDIWKVHTDL